MPSPAPRRHWLSVLGLLLCLCANRASSVTPWFARVWQVDDGLPADNVTGVAQTLDGYLWVATQSGLARFDGVRIQPIDVPVGRPRPIIRALLLDVNQRLWMAEERGVVVCFSSAGSRIFTTTNGLSRAQPLKVVQSEDQSIWIAYSDGSVCRIHREKVTRFANSQIPPAKGACSLTCDTQGQLWYAKGGQVGMLQQGRFVPTATFNERYIEVQTAAEGGIWICAGDKLLRCKSQTAPVEVTRIPVSSVVTRPTALYEDRAGGLWIATSADGLFHFDGTNAIRVTTSHPLIRSITEDREGNIWVGTDGGGLNRLRPQVVELQGRDDGLPYDTVRSVCEDTTGRLWVVTQNGAVATSRGDGWEIISATKTWPGGQATCVTCDLHGVVWIGTYSRGLYLREKGDFRIYRRADGLASSSVRSMLADRQGNLWIAFSAANTLQKLREGHFENYQLPKGSRAVRAMAEDAAGDIWMANLDGQLLRVTGTNVVDETPRDGDRLRPIRCLAGTPDGSLWIGYSAAGVGRLKAGRFASIDSGRGLQDDSICSLVPGEFGWVWFCSDHGIFCVNGRELAAAMDGTTSVRSIAYAKDQGLPSLQGAYGYSPGAARTRDGRILIPTHAGLAIVHPDRVQPNQVRLPVLIESVAVDSKVKQTGQSYLTLSLPAKHRKLEIVYTAPSFIEADKVRFRYRMEGLDENWVDAGNQRRAVYPRLPAGTYRFRVTAANNAGVWNENGAFFTLQVQPFFWNTWWFRLTAVIAFTGLIFAVVRYVSVRRLQSRVRRLEQENALQQERARIAQDIHDDLGASMTQISLLSELTQQALPEPEKARELVGQIAATSRQSIRSLDEIVWAVTPRNDTLPDLLDYAGQYAVDFLRTAGIRCRVDFPDAPPPRTIPADARHGLFLAIKEALNNVVKHAHATEVWLRVKVTNQSLQWVIEDNGLGLGGSSSDPWADGLRNMRQRLADLGGHCTADRANGGGARITFEVPWQRQT